MYLPPRLTDRAARRRGFAAAELALMLPVLCVLLIGAIDLCRLFYHYNVITNCARNGALWLSDPYSNGTLTSQSPYANYQDAALADAIANNNLNPAPTSANISSSTGTDGYGNPTAIVTVTYQFNMVSSYLGFGSVNLSRSVAMRVQPQWPN
jgi:Flp pilus assembly protein TadG